MNILMLSSTFPYPPTRGGTQVRTFNLLKYLRQHHSLTLVTQRDRDVTDSQIAELQQCVDQLLLFDRPQAEDTSPRILRKIHGLCSFLCKGTPPSVLNRYSAKMQQRIDGLILEGKYDVITCEHSVNEIYIRPHFSKNCSTIVNIHSSVYATCLNQLTTGTSENKLRDRINLPLLYRYEQNYCHKFSHIVVTTEEDKLQIQKFHPPGEISVIPNGVDLVAFPYRTADPGGYRLIFIGAMDNLPNIDAVCFFSQAILPEIQKVYPQTTFDIVGARPTAEVLALQAKPGVNVIGSVPSMVEYLHKATLCVIPMRTGFGIKNKTLEAMAAGVPVVGSDRGLEGLTVDDGTTPLRALRANQPIEYVAAIVKLFTQPGLRFDLSRNGRQLVETEFTWEIAGQRYAEICLGKNHLTNL